MTLTPVKTTVGSRLRHPTTKALLPNVTDTDAQSVRVNLADPYWYKALARGDIEVIEADIAPVPPAAADPAPAKAALAKAAPAEPATSAPTTAPASTSKA